MPQSLDLLGTNKSTMIAIAKMAADVFGVNTIATGLACVPTAPATLSVNVNPGQLYQNVVVDQNTYSDIALDTTHSIVKSGILMDAQNFAITAPGTAGYSQNYLIQATFLETDTDNLVLPYYNAANPSQAFNGPAGGGGTQPTRRAGQVSLQLLAGTAATTGTQTTPAVTTGYIGLWVVTVANGQATITAGNITQYAGAPILPSSLLASIQNGNLSYAVATGMANAHVAAFTPVITQRVDGMLLRYKAPAANTGSVTLNDGLGAVAVVGAAHSALQGGEYIQNGDALVMWNSSIGGGSYILLECTGGALQITPATQPLHAMQLGQATGRLLKVSVYSAAGTQTFTAQAATKSVIVIALGAGAGAGGCAAQGSGTVSMAGGGGGGAYCVGQFTSGFSSVTVTIGAGGAGGVGGSAGSAGGTSSFGTLVSCPGGAAASAGPGIATGTNAIAPGGNASVQGSGGNLFSALGAPGGWGIYVGSALAGGTGGASGMGNSGPSGGGSNAPGQSALASFGCGGSGGAVGASGAAQNGGAGAQGYVIVYEYS